jgi:hypothetical protein
MVHTFNITDSIALCIYTIIKIDIIIDALLTNKYNTKLPTPEAAGMIKEKKVRVVYVQIRAARPGIKPTLVVPIPREIVNKLSIVEGETFAMFVESEKSFRLVRTKT